FQAEDGIRDATVTGVQTCALPISINVSRASWRRWPTGSRSTYCSRSERARRLRRAPRWRARWRCCGAERLLRPKNEEEAMSADRSEERRVGKEWRARGALSGAEEA